MADEMRSAQVAFFLPHLGGGGTERMVARLAGGLAGRGYSVDMVLARAEGHYLDGLPPTIRVVDLHAADEYRALPGLTRYLRQHRPGMLVSSLSLANLIAVIARELAGGGSRLAIRLESTVSAQRREPWKKWLERPLLSLLYPHADHIIAVANAVADDAVSYLNIPRRRLQVIYNPVLEGLRPPGPQAAPHPWLEDGCPPVILGVGRLVPVKDFPMLVEAFAAVRQKREARLMILGEGEQRSRLLQLAQQSGVAKDVDLPGFVPDPQAYMRRSHVFVLSSLYEGLPTVLVEALAGGCRVISTDCPGGAREILGGGEYGMLVPVGDVPAMSAAIDQALSARPPAIPTEWLERFTLESVLDRTISLLGLPQADARRLSG